MSVLSGSVARSSVRIEESAPPYRPKGVRTASQMKTSVMPGNPSDATAHGNRRSMNRARGVRGEKQDHLGERIRRDPAQRVRLGHIGAILRRVDDAGQDAVDVDSFVAQFGRHAL